MLGRTIRASHYAELLAAGRHARAPWLDLDKDTLEKAYNRTPFVLEHRLTGHPYFSLEQLFSLCRRLPAEQILYRVGDIPGDAELDTSYERFRNGLTLPDVLEHFEEKHAYVCINNPELDPTYGRLIEGLIGEIVAGIEHLDPYLSWYSTYIFISSQHSVTPYHMDREMNFLLQVSGGKTVYLWDQDDSEIMSAEEKDRLLAHRDGRPGYRPSFESKAMIFRLTPGQGVHHPFIAPHRVHTGDALSISLALTFRTRRSDMWTDAHRFNTRLRGMGFHPEPVGRHVWLDRTKCGLARAGQCAHRMLAAAGRTSERTMH